ncbi:hypothetical protein DL95DRAFT_66577 [Leptodontidium sp. 2 PMI_412]|nr:hypothetical protein DL95DRAFT_66577 [Leptodontidium sp. 2 PMI_412]
MICNASMSCLYPSGSNDVYKHDEQGLALVRRDSRASSNARNHRKLDSDSAFPGKFGQGEKCAWAPDRPITVSKRTTREEVTEAGFSFKKDLLDKLDIFQSNVPSNNRESSQSSLKSLHSTSQPRVPLMLPRSLELPSTEVDKPDQHIAKAPEGCPSVKHVVMAGSEHIGIVPIPWIPNQQVSHPPGPATPPIQPTSVTKNDPLPKSQLMDSTSFDKDWPKIQRLRVNIWSLRSTIHERRGALRAKQLARADAGDRYLQSIRARSLGGARPTFAKTDLEDPTIAHELKMMEDLLHDFQVASDEYGPLEDDCNLLEDTLSAQEYELQKLEKRFYEQEMHGSLLDADAIPRQASTSSAYSGSEIDQEFHPFVAEYLSKVGDVEILKERLEYHEEERFNLEEERATKKRVALDLASDDEEWLDNFDATKRELQDEIDREEAELEVLKARCFSEGLIDEDGDIKDFDVREKETFANEADVDAGRETSGYAKFPILISEPGGQISHVDEPTVDQEEPRLDFNFAVNKWLLRQLRMSPLEVNLLSRTYELQYGMINEREKWQHDLLRLWYSDDPGKEWFTTLTSSEAITMAPRKTACESTVSSVNSRYQLSDVPMNGGLLDQANRESESINSGDDDTTFAAPRPTPLATIDTHIRLGVHSRSQFAGTKPYLHFL